MRFLGFAVVTGAAIMLGACGGEKAATTDSAAAPAAEAAAAPAEAAPAAGAMAPITGTTHEIKMIGDGAGYRFEPANLTVAAGDGVKFTLVSGGPHNVAFDGAAIDPKVLQAQQEEMAKQQQALQKQLEERAAAERQRLEAQGGAGAAAPK